ncbi:uncharacterized protein LOC132917415 [Rhopalosiphum padi]|uniref:uncharacterized protein LOC132917415 n=1 Tax=Rhopalosiphum padi TaxID=40932 RepID=UPI00298E597A|nr:uncharacterized protein LOC132917415 [Rhopalosiphum padi]
MSVKILTVMAVALMLFNDSLFIKTAQLNVSTDAPLLSQVNRTSKELQDTSKLVQDISVELKTSGRKSTPEDYNTFSSLTSDVFVETPSSISNPKLYPSLTTSMPAFVTRGRYIRNPFFFSKDDQEVEFEEDQHADVLLNSGFPKWNRYNTNHRQLNKYGPTPIETDITVDEDGSTGYGSTFDFGGGGGNVGASSYDSGSYRNPNNGWSGGDMMEWYSDPVPQSSRPVPIIAEIRHPSKHKMSIDVTKIGLLALVKIALAKLKALGFIKAMLLMLFKLKLLILVLAIKALMLMKIVKMTLFLPALLSIFTFPMILSRLTNMHSLLSQPVLVPNNFGMNQGGTPGGNAPGNGGGSDDGGDDDGKRRSRLDQLEIMGTGMTSFRQIMRTEKCVERVSCRMAGAERPSWILIWLNWAASPISNYIPSKKIRSFVSTFTEVTNFRLDNLYTRLLPSNWTEWCNEHYACGENKKIG